MLPERRRASPVQWTVLVAVLLNALLGGLWLGKLSQKVDDLAAQVMRLEQRLDPPRQPKPPGFH